MDWPQNLPARQYFQCAYQADPVNREIQDESEYLRWVVDFYQGNLLYPSGWNDVEAAVLAITPPALRQDMQVQFENLGRRIAAEWSKDNSVRLIDNRLLSLWGSILQLAPDERQINLAITVIDADIAAILARQLDPASVDERRYEEVLEIQLFEGF